MKIRVLSNTSGEDKMNGESKKLSRMSVAGFLIALLNIVFVLLTAFFAPGILRSAKDAWWTMWKLTVFAVILEILLPCIGSVFSVIGIINSIRKKMKGKVLAIAGIVLNELEIICIILFFLFILSFGLIGY